MTFTLHVRDRYTEKTQSVLLKVNPYITPTVSVDSVSQSGGNVVVNFTIDGTAARDGNFTINDPAYRPRFSLAESPVKYGSAYTHGNVFTISGNLSGRSLGLSRGSYTMTWDADANTMTSGLDGREGQVMMRLNVHDGWTDQGSYSTGTGEREPQRLRSEPGRSSEQPDHRSRPEHQLEHQPRRR